MSSPTPLSPSFSLSSQTKAVVSMNQWLLDYTTHLQAESEIAIAVYRSFIHALAVEGERYAIPEFTLHCMRQAAEKSVTNYRLSQIALLNTISDPETRLLVAQSCEKTSRAEDAILALLALYHEECLEALNGRT
jgi:hypothetical protein